MNPIRASLIMSSLAAIGVAQAQTAAPAAPATTPVVVTKTDTSTSLTWNGITLYGIVDIGLQYQTHGVPISDYFPAGSEAIISKNSHGSITGLTPNNLSQSRIGLSGLEPIGSDFAFVFRLETFFNPQSGNLSDALKSITLNNGKSLQDQTTTVDSSVAGQLFAGAAYAGFTHKQFGSLTFGRHVTLLADGIAKYDPMGAAQAFSVIGFSGTAGGGGDTEDRRLDDSVKYFGKYGPVHLGVLYQFNGAEGSANTAIQAQLGFELAGGSIDGYYAKKKGAVAASPLSATQMINLSEPYLAGGGGGNSASNSVVGTISDNETYSVMGLYNFGAPKIFAGYEHIKFENPENLILPGTSTIGGYILAYTNNNAYAHAKTLEVIWAGGKFAFTDSFEVTAAYYGYRQDAFAGGADAGCDSDVSSACKGQLNAFSVLGDYKFSKRLDVYLGSMWSEVQDGLASGYLSRGPSGSASTITTTAGMRFKF
jgi:predicted porin